ncbi:MAG: ribose-phosphate diphosphokinase [Bacilli bacterium]|nr:ribose-phosphate diphosphokinase [Bacteroidales bacterium]MDD4188029.1 ribose-phosphate diphosphokinase [Bacilli bacterium]
MEAKDNIRILFMDTVKDLGQSVKKILIDENGFSENNFINVEITRFGNGEGKAKLINSVRGKRFFIVTDVCNHSLEYKAYGQTHTIMSDEHFQDLKRVISASCGNTTEITVVETILYAGRQHKRNGRESLDCAIGLQELEKMNVKCITTFDAHNVEVRQAIPLTSFDNVIPTEPMLSKFVQEEKINYDNLIVISPDEGAMGRTRFYSGMLGCDIGMFYKRRDYSKVDENGKNPIAEHAYLGKEIENGEYLIIDDMISSGGSIIEILNKLKIRNPKKIWVMATFSLFTEGLEKFDQAYEDGILQCVYSSNFTDIPEGAESRAWFKRVDCSKLLADCLITYAKDEPMSNILNGRKELYDKIAKLKLC